MTNPLRETESEFDPNLTESVDYFVKHGGTPRRYFREGLFFGLRFLAIIMFLGILLSPLTLSANALGTQKGPVFDCLQCHDTKLEKHNILGSGSSTCTSCHDELNMKKLILLNGTQLDLKDSPKVCGQCHRGQYNAWETGIHGKPGDKVECTKCHDPHKPYITGISTLAPPPQTTPPITSVAPLAFITTLSLTLGVAVVLALKKRRELDE